MKPGLNTEEKILPEHVQTMEAPQRSRRTGTDHLLLLVAAPFDQDIFDDEFSKIDQLFHATPLSESTLAEALLKDSAYPFIDNINTPEKETLQQIVTAAYRQTVGRGPRPGQDRKVALPGQRTGADTWARHLLHLPALSRTHLPIGGGTHCINAAKQFHGPSWRDDRLPDRQDRAPIRRLPRRSERQPRQSLLRHLYRSLGRRQIFAIVGNGAG